MPWDFVDREQLLRQLLTYIRIAPPEKRLVLLDSPAGMGKTFLLIEACRQLIEDAGERWKIVRLDFRDPDKAYVDRRAVLEEIARQICRDIRWDNVCSLVQQAASGDQNAQSLIRQAVSIPMADESRKALLRAVRTIDQQDLTTIRELIVQAFNSVDLQELLRTPGFADQEKQVAILVGFILGKKAHSPTSDLIPDNVLLVFDNLDGIRDETMREWVVSELALWLHDGLQMSFKRFFVTVCDRYIRQRLSHAVREQYYMECDPGPFRPEDIEAVIRRFDDDRFSGQQHLVSRLAGKLLQVSGGHPKVIKDIAWRLYDGSPGHFSALVHDPLRAGYWYDNPYIGIRQTLVACREEAIHNIAGGIDPRQKLALELLCVFRHFNKATLEVLCSKTESCAQQIAALDRYKGHFADDIDNVFDSLLETRLIWYGGLQPFYSGRIVLNLMAAQMQEEEPELFHWLNEWATKIFADWAVGRFSDDPERLRPIPGDYQLTCVREWLFHRLCLAGPCRSEKEARALGQRISQDLADLLRYVVPFPGESDNKARLQWIERDVKDDKQIDHRMWEIALEQRERHDALRTGILDTFLPST